MATVTKDFRIKSGLVVEGTTGTINGNTILTSADTTSAVDEGTNLYYTNERVDDRVANLVTGGTGITVSYDDNGNAIGISTDFTEFSTTNITEGDKLFFTNQRAIDAVGGSATAANTPNTVVKRDGSGNFSAGQITATEVVVQTAGIIFEDSGLNIQSTTGNGIGIIASEGVNVTAQNADIVLQAADGSVYKNSAISGNELVTQDRLDQYIGDNTVNGSTGNTITDRIGSVAGDLSTHESDTSTHGVTGDIVGTSDAQTLTNKTMGDDLLMDGNQISGLPMPDQADHAASKAYVDSVSEGLHIHASAVVATTANIDITNDLQVGDVIDGVTLADTNRVLVKNQTTASQNGIYVVQPSGAAIRALDFDAPSEVDGGDFIFVTGGDTQADTGWVQTSEAVVTIGSDAINFTQFSGAGTFLAGNGLVLDGNTFEIDETITATRTFASGEASTAETNAKSYTDDLIGDATVDGTAGDTVTDRIATAVSSAVGDLTDAINGYLDPSTGTTVEYIDDQDAATLLAANGYSDALVAAGDDTATPQYLAININDVAKQVAATSNAFATLPTTAISFPKASFRSAKFLVKVAYGTHTEVSEVLLTLDTSDNIAITEFAVVGTNGSMSTITADVGTANVNLVVTPVNDSAITVVGTLLV
jgi:hypothetical protein